MSTKSAEDWRVDFEKNPVKTGKRAVWTIALFVLLTTVVLGTIGSGLSWFGEGARVAKQEFGPQAMLHKYEWFVDQANAVKKMDQDVVIFKQRQVSTKTQYAGYGNDMSKWPLDVRVQYNTAIGQTRDDLAAVISQRNNLVRDYNAASEKFNWSPFQTRSNKPDQRFDEYSE